MPTLTRLWIFIQHGIMLTLLYYPAVVIQQLIRLLPSDAHVRGSSNQTESSKPKGKTESTVQKIERTTRRSVTIRKALTEENLEKCDPQADSPLYQLPQELRDIIFEYASAQTIDRQHQYSENAYYYRPGHTARRKSYTNHLLTCRRAWLEANTMPMQLAEHVFWFHRGPETTPTRVQSPPEGEHYSRLMRIARSNIRNITQLHFFYQMYEAERIGRMMDGFFGVHLLERGLQPKLLHFTIRQSDWWNWEDDRPLELKEEWLKTILDSERLGGVEEFRLELETVDYKRGELDAIVERLRQLEGKPKLTDPTNTDCPTESTFVMKTPPREWHWERSPKLDGKDWTVFSGLTKLKLHVVVLSWYNKVSPRNHTTTGAPSVTPGNKKELQSSDRRSFGALVFPHRRLRMLQRRQRESMLSQGVWTRMAFPIKEEICWMDSIKQADQFQNDMKVRFERLMGDMEASAAMRAWKACHSLLEFEEPDIKD